MPSRRRSCNSSAKAVDLVCRDVEHDPTARERRRGKRDARRAPSGVCGSGGIRSLRLAGSPSDPLATTTVRRLPLSQGPPLGANGKPGSSVASKAAGVKFVQKRGPCAVEWQIAPVCEVRCQVDDGVRRMERAQEAWEPRGRGRVAVDAAKRGSHWSFLEVPDTVPVILPVDWSMLSCMSRSMRPLGPATVAPMVEPSSAVTSPWALPRRHCYSSSTPLRLPLCPSA